MARKASMKVAAISGVSAIAVTGLIAFAGSNIAVADDLVNPTSSESADRLGHQDRMHGGESHDAIDGQIIDRTETFVDENGVVTTHTISTGTVTSVDGNTVTYTNLDGETLTVVVGDETVIYRDGEVATAAHIATDDLIVVEIENVDGVETVESLNLSSTGELPAHLGRGHGHHGRDGMMGEKRGKPIGEETTYQDADGNVVTEIDYRGVVTSVDTSSITIELADGTSVTVEINDETVIDKSHVAATLSDLVATDHVKVEVVDGIAIEIHAMTAEEFANFADGRGGMGHGPDADSEMGGHHGRGHHGR